jgi:HTH-type transcriptional regulator/antitoxin HipB
MAEKLGITQQSYAYFEGNPARAPLERLFLVLRLLDVEISLDQTSPASVPSGQRQPTAEATPIIAPSGQKERW